MEMEVGGEKEGPEASTDAGTNGAAKLGKADNLGGLIREGTDWVAEKVLVVVVVRLVWASPRGREDTGRDFWIKEGFDMEGRVVVVVVRLVWAKGREELVN